MKTCTNAGEYAVHVYANEVDIGNSPFMVCARESSVSGVSFDVKKVVVSGPGIESKGMVFADECTYFLVDPRAAFDNREDSFAGIEAVTASVYYLGSEGAQVSRSACIGVHVSILPEGTFKCEYTPSRIGTHSIFVTFAGESLREEPFQVFYRFIEFFHFTNSENNRLICLLRVTIFYSNF